MERSPEAPNPRPNVATRGSARPERQLGRVQIKILRWLLAKTQRQLDEQGHDPREPLPYVAWDGAKAHLDLDERESAVSEALKGKRGRSLEQRGLVTVYCSGRRALRVRLTPSGEAMARITTADGGSEREIEAAKLAIWERRHGKRRTWDRKRRDAFKRAVEAEIEARHNASRLFGRRLRRATPEEVERLLRDYAEQTPEERIPEDD